MEIFITIWNMSKEIYFSPLKELFSAYEKIVTIHSMSLRFEIHIQRMCV